jgi:capsular polysaccharide export protein
VTRLHPDSASSCFCRVPTGPSSGNCPAPSKRWRARCGWASTAATTSSGPTGRATSRRPRRWTLARGVSPGSWPTGRHRPRGLRRHPPDPRRRHRARRTARGITVHVFEEGYLRPYWVTYERGGANGNSPLMAMTVDEMRRALEGGRHGPAGRARPLGRSAPACLLRRALSRARPCREPPLRGGPTASRALREAGVPALPQAPRADAVALARPAWRRRGHPARPIPITSRCCNWNTTRASATTAPSRRRRSSSRPSSPVSPRARPRHHHLVFKAHPLEDGRAPLRASIRRPPRPWRRRPGAFRAWRQARAASRQARSAVTVNSTSAQQALWRGLPLKCFGAAVYASPSSSRISRSPILPRPGTPRQRGLPREFRHYLLQTSQLPAASTPRADAASCCAVVDRMLRAGGRLRDPQQPKQASKQHLAVVK